MIIMKKKIENTKAPRVLPLIFLLMATNLLFCAPKKALDSSTEALKNNAIRCLKVAKEYFNIENFSSASTNAQMGIAYYDKISDLYYYLAASKTKVDDCKGKILPLIERAIDMDNWVDYSRDNARILYAQLLCDTNEEEKALSVLGEKPLIFLPDCQYIKAKASYKLLTKKGFEKARVLIDDARKVYPDDERFPLLFFKYEYLLDRERGLGALKNSLSSGSNKIRDSLTKYFKELTDEGKIKNVDAKIYCAFFSNGEEKERRIKTFSSEGGSHILLPIAAAEAGLMDGAAAWKYLAALNPTDIKERTLYTITNLIDGDESREIAKKFLSDFSGQYLIDTDLDGETEMTIKYYAGRPQSFSFDKNNDGLFEIEGECLDGDITKVIVPVAPAIRNGRLVSSDAFINDNTSDEHTYTATLSYNKFPRVKEATILMPPYKGPVQNVKPADPFCAKFTIPHDIYTFDPCTVKADGLIKRATGEDFFVIMPTTHKSITERALLSVASFYEVPSINYEGVISKFTVLNGVIQSAEHTLKNNRVYARTIFENGVPTIKIIDLDMNGTFELVKEYAPLGKDIVDPDTAEEELLILSLYGIPSLATEKIYLKSTKIDYDGDTQIDYQEDFLSYKEKIAIWRPAGDKDFALKYHRYPRRSPKADLKEESQFYSNEGALITITQINGVCTNVTDGTKTYPVTNGKNPSFYWVGETGSEVEEAYLLEHFNHLEDSVVPEGVCVVLDETNNRVILIKVAGNLYAQIVKYTEPIDNDENDKDLAAKKE